MQRLPGVPGLPDGYDRGDQYFFWCHDVIYVDNTGVSMAKQPFRTCGRIWPKTYAFEALKREIRIEFR
jgi:hypothetical protein